MNPAYLQARFQAELPFGGLPENFGIVTACNPYGKPASAEANAAATASLRGLIEREGWPYFPVTGGSADFSHAEPGFGVIASEIDCMALGRVFKQDAIFWVNRGHVFLMPCSGQRARGIELWSNLATGQAAHPAVHFSGPPALLTAPCTAFFCSTQCPGDAVLKAYAWARRQCDEQTAVISGFHTPVEKDVRAILARRGAKIIWVPARDIPIVLDATLRPANEEGRLLILSPFHYGKPSRPTQKSASQRNQFILARTPNRYIAHAAPGSTLAKDLDPSL
jgi:hypothetical protein